MKQPTEGGRYNRDPNTGELTKVTEVIEETVTQAAEQPVVTENNLVPEPGKRGK